MNLWEGPAVILSLDPRCSSNAWVSFEKGSERFDSIMDQFADDVKLSENVMAQGLKRI